MTDAATSPETPVGASARSGPDARKADSAPAATRAGTPAGVPSGAPSGAPAGVPSSDPIEISADGMADLLPDALLVLDSDMRVVRANRVALQMTGYAESDLVGRFCSETLSARDLDGRDLSNSWHASTRLRSVSGIAEQTIVLRKRDGRDLVTSLSGSFQRDASGNLATAVVTFRNAARQARTGVSGMEIVSTVSHELRSPLTSVKGYTSLLINRWDRLRDDQKQMMLEQVNHDADRVTRLITELLDISRLETGRLRLRRQLVDLPRLAATVVEKVRLEYPELEATVEFPDGFPKVYADPDKVEQVLTNLVENACKYGSPRGLRIEGSLGNESVSVAVSDLGDGIPPEDLPKVFTKFFRRSEGRPTGSGLGLWISRGLVESHGGDLTAESNLGTGSTFTFTLPLLDLDKLQEL
ncbi:MAG TPA: PAS domain-containing sensor histidine kinase [Acidimicrobiales bacterium]